MKRKGKGRRMKGLVVRSALAVWATRAELLVVFSGLSGWALVTWGLASLLDWRVWPISTGILFLGLTGYRLILRMLLDGVYVLSREGGGGGRDR